MVFFTLNGGRNSKNVTYFLILQLSCPILGNKKGREPWERVAAALSYGRKSKMPVSLNYVKIIRDLREDADKTQQEIADDQPDHVCPV